MVFQLYMNCKCDFVLTNFPAVNVVSILNKCDFFKLGFYLIWVYVFRCRFEECCYTCTERLYCGNKCYYWEDKSTQRITPPSLWPNHNYGSSNCDSYRIQQISKYMEICSLKVYIPLLFLRFFILFRFIYHIRFCLFGIDSRLVVYLVPLLDNCLYSLQKLTIKKKEDWPLRRLIWFRNLLNDSLDFLSYFWLWTYLHFQYQAQ